MNYSEGLWEWELGTCSGSQASVWGSARDWALRGSQNFLGSFHCVPLISIEATSKSLTLCFSDWNSNPRANFLKLGKQALWGRQNKIKLYLLFDGVFSQQLFDNHLQGATSCAKYEGRNDAKEGNMAPLYINVAAR